MKGFFKVVLGSLVALFIFFGISIGLSMCSLVALSTISTQPQNTKLDKHSILRIKLSGVLAERSQNSDVEAFYSLMNDRSYTLSLSDIRIALDRAKENLDKVDALFLDCNMLSAGIASHHELLDMLKAFKEETSLPILAYADHYTQGTYLISTVADSVFLNPQGSVFLSGMTANSMFFADALDKLGIKMQVFKVGTFKSAVEPYLLNEMSEANRLQMTAMVDALWREYSGCIFENKGVSVDDINKYIDNGGMFRPASYALEMGLVDGLRYRKDVIDLLDMLYTKDSRFVSVRSMCNVLEAKSYSANKVAVLYATGGIDDGSSDGMKSDKIVKELNKLAKNKKVKAVVLRVNSPGGSAFGSDQMWDAARRLRKEKPLIVSMSDYAASGGYYMSCIADTIVAMPSTLTGSIGIFGVFPNVEGLISKMGISVDGVKTHEFADFGNSYRPMTEQERVVLQRYINAGYENFVGRCAEGRGMPVDSIKAVAEGRVWSGADALRLGLVDELGGLQRAIEIAAEKANLTDNYSVAEYPKQKDLYSTLFELLNEDLSARFVKSKLGKDAYLYDAYVRATSSMGVQALMPYVVEM